MGRPVFTFCAGSGLQLFTYQRGIGVGFRIGFGLFTGNGAMAKPAADDRWFGQGLGEAPTLCHAIGKRQLFHQQ